MAERRFFFLQPGLELTFFSFAVFPSTTQEWIILNDPVTETADAAETALGLAARTADAAGSGAGLLRAKQSEGGSLLFHFESSVVGRSVFNEQTLLLMKEIDTIVMSVPGYTEVCQLAYDDNDVSTGCVPRVSPVLYFFPTIDAVTGNVTNDGNGEMVTDIDAVVRSFRANKRAFGYFLDSEFDDSSDGANLFNKVTRVKYPMGAPRAGFVAADDEENKQRSEIGELWLDFVEQALFKRFAMKAEFLSTPYMGLVNEQNTDVRFYAGYLRSKDSQQIIGLDLSWAGASVLAVWAYMCVSGLSQIPTPFAVTVRVYSGNIYQYWQLLHTSQVHCLLPLDDYSASNVYQYWQLLQTHTPDSGLTVFFVQPSQGVPHRFNVRRVPGDV